MLKYHLIYKEAYYYNIVKKWMNDISGLVMNLMFDYNHNKNK